MKLKESAVFSLLQPITRYFFLLRGLLHLHPLAWRLVLKSKDIIFEQRQGYPVEQIDQTSRGNHGSDMVARKQSVSSQDHTY